MEQLEKLMEFVIKPTGDSPVHICMLYVKEERSGVNISRALGLTGEKGKNITIDDCFRTGSNTKLFTATIILQLIEEGLIKT